MKKLAYYPGSELSKKELLARLDEAYQVAGALLLGPRKAIAKEVRTEMEVVLLDFLSDPTTADRKRLRLAARAFHPFPPKQHHDSAPKEEANGHGTDDAGPTGGSPEAA